MGRYVLKRLLILIPTLIAVTIIVFTLMNFVPGDPVMIALARAPTRRLRSKHKESPWDWTGPSWCGWRNT